MAFRNPRPDAQGAYSNWVLNGAATKWQAVDPGNPISHDDVTTHVGINELGSVNVKESFSVQADLVAAAIIAVRYGVRHQHTGASHGGLAVLSAFARLSGVDGAGAGSNINANTWTTASGTLTRPGGGSWAVADITGGALEVGFYVSAEGTSPAPVSQVVQVTSVWIEVEYVPVAAKIGPAREVGSRVIRLRGRQIETPNVSGPLLLADHELLDDITISHKAGPHPSDAGWGELAHQRGHVMLLGAELDLDSLTVKGKGLLLPGYAVRFWDTMRSEFAPSAQLQGIARLDAGAGRQYVRAGKTWIENPESALQGAVQLVQLDDDIERLDPRGEVLEQSAINRVIHSSFAAGSGASFTGWTISGSGTPTEDTADILFESGISGRSLKMTASATISTDFQAAATATASVPANTVGCLSVYHKDDSGSAGWVAIQRGVDSKWWRASDRTWQASKTWNALPVRSGRWRDALRRIDVGTSATTLTVHVGAPASGGVGNQANHWYHAQWQDTPYPTSPIHTTTAAVTHPADNLKVENFHGRRVWGVEPGAVDHGSASLRFVPDWDTADLPAGSGRMLVHVSFDGSNYDTIDYDQATGAFRFLRAVAGVGYAATKAVTVTAGEEIALAVRWTGAAGERGLAPYTLSLFVHGVKGTDAVAVMPGAGVIPSYPYMYLGQDNGGARQADGALAHLEVTDYVLADEELADMAAA